MLDTARPGMSRRDVDRGGGWPGHARGVDWIIVPRPASRRIWHGLAAPRGGAHITAAADGTAAQKGEHAHRSGRCRGACTRRKCHERKAGWLSARSAACQRKPKLSKAAQVRGPTMRPSASGPVTPARRWNSATTATVCRPSLRAQINVRVRGERGIEEFLQGGRKIWCPYIGKKGYVSLGLVRICWFRATAGECHSGQHERDARKGQQGYGLAEDQDAALDGFYVLRTPVPASDLDAPSVVSAYKNLKYAERDFRHIKSDDLDLRPVFHRLEERVRSHVLICMLACYLTWHLRRAWAPLTFTNENPPHPDNPVAPARRSPHAQG